MSLCLPVCLFGKDETTGLVNGGVDQGCYSATDHSCNLTARHIDIATSLAQCSSGNIKSYMADRIF